MNKAWAEAWIKGFETGGEAICEFYADDAHFEEITLKMSIEGNKEELFRCLDPFSNKDPSTGFGVHTFTVLEYVGDERSGFVVWQWDAADCAEFIGVPVPKGMALQTRGITGIRFNEDGKIIRDWNFFDAIHVLQELGYPLKTPQYWKEGWKPDD
jgi:steroid delta-isomerase-like uncharacterized protein